MSYQKLLQWVIGSTLVLLLLVRCGAPPATPVAPTVPPTVTPVPPTDTPEPPSCEKVEGNCLWLSFDGESCIYEGPTALKAGPITLLFLNESETTAYAGLVKLTGDKTIQDLIEYNGEEPSTKHAPFWTQTIFAYQVVPEGGSNIWKGLLEVGTYGMVCIRVTPHGAWVATGLTVDK